MKNDKQKKNRLRLFFMLGVSVILLLAVALIVVLEYIIIQTKMFKQEEIMGSGLFWIIVLGVASIILGAGLAFLFSHFVIKPYDKLIDGMSKLSSGDYSARINMGKHLNFPQVSAKFNALATELENTEILRSDFVNNFSHEIKTPVVSISSLLGLLKKEDLPNAKRKEYVKIIEEEITRLSDMTTNMLNLSKVEKQEILTNKTSYNLSEQIRTCVLFLQNKWERKSISFSLDFNEVFIKANEDMLKQVWFNLLDNAIKFSNVGGEVDVSVLEDEKTVTIKVLNNGVLIKEEEQDKIFNKFYRGEQAKEKDGNGIGLSIVKRIIELHEGKISANVENEKTCFTVVLDK